MDEKSETSEKSSKSSLPTAKTSESSSETSSAASRTPKKKFSEEFSEDGKSESPKKTNKKEKEDSPEVFEVPSDLTKSQQEENKPQESALHNIKIEKDDQEQKPETKDVRNESPTSETDTSKGQPEETTEPSEEKSEPPEESGPSSADSEATEEKGKKPSYFQKKRDSLVRFVTGKDPGEEEEKKKSQSPAKKRPSFVRRKLIKLENELTMDNINKGVTSIFSPEPKKSEQGDAEDPDKEQTEKAEPTHLSSGMACLMIIAVTTGHAISVMPYHLYSSSWFGVFLNIWLGVNAMYAGLCTGWCWTAMEERWPEYLEYSRIPYQDIAYRASGTWMKCIVAILIDVSVLGTSGVYILVMAGVMENLAIGKLHFCHLTMIIAVCLLPFLMFGSFRNVRFLGFIDVLLSFLFVLLIIVLFFLEKPSIGRVHYTDPYLNAVVESFAGFSYAYGSGGVIPSILSDMEDRTQFTYSLVTAYMVCIALYTILPVLGYAAYGENTPRYILKAILENNEGDTILYYLSVVIVVIQFLQLATTFVLAFFPTLHAFEVRVNCSDKFGLYRILVRIIIWLCLLVVILGAPSLPQVMDLVGATTLNFTTYILPPIFYVCLVCGDTKPQKRHRSKKEWFLIIETVFIGLVVLIICTFVAIQGYGHFRTNRASCFLNSTILKV